MIKQDKIMLMAFLLVNEKIMFVSSNGFPNSPLFLYHVLGISGIVPRLIRETLL